MQANGSMEATLSTVYTVSVSCLYIFCLLFQTCKQFGLKFLPLPSLTYLGPHYKYVHTTGEMEQRPKKCYP